MKSISLSRTILTSFLLATSMVVHSAYAGAGGFDPFKSTKIEQIIQIGIAGAAKSSTFINTAANVKKVFTDTILKPLGDKLLGNLKQQATKNVTAWAKGGFEGNSLIKSSPEKYLVDEKLAGVKSALNALPKNSYGDSLFNSIVKDYKGQDTKSKITSYAQSGIPSTVQGGMCSDSALTTRATSDVRARSSTYTQKDIAVRKKELYDYACSCNPTSDSKCAARLVDIYKQNPSVAGWDGWNRLIGGDNGYANSVRTSIVVAQEAAKAEELAKNDLYFGQGEISEKKCVKYEDLTDGLGQPECTEWAVVTPGKTVTASVNTAVTGQLDSLFKRTSNGFDLGDLSNLSTLAFDSIAGNMFDSIIPSSGGGGSSRAGSSNTSVTLETKTPSPQDLTGDEARRSETIRLAADQIEIYTQGLVKLRAIDKDYLEKISAYDSTILNVKNCYDNLLTDNIAQANDNRMISGRNFYNGRLSATAAIKNSILVELFKISDAEKLSTTALAQVQASYSTDEITKLLASHQKTINSGQYPSVTDWIEREGKLSEDFGKSQNDSGRDESLKACADIRTSSRQNINYSNGAY